MKYKLTLLFFILFLIPHCRIIDYDELKVEEVIGSGSFGDVFSGEYEGQKVAIKSFLKRKVSDNAIHLLSYFTMINYDY